MNEEVEESAEQIFDTFSSRDEDTCLTYEKRALAGGGGFSSCNEQYILFVGKVIG